MQTRGGNGESFIFHTVGIEFSLYSFDLCNFNNEIEKQDAVPSPVNGEPSRRGLPSPKN